MTQIREIGDITKGGCPHFWVIESAGGPTSIGHCKLCGAQKQFFNSVPEAVPLNRASVLELPEIAEVELDEGQKS